jgi:predicted metal-dependent phosphoesterase TrpH
VVPPAPSTIDLHTHTRRSDGVLEPAALVQDAAAAGVRLLAITDHDSLAGYREVAAGLPVGLDLLPGVEINAIGPIAADLWEGEVHILGFGMDPVDDAFEQALLDQRAQRRVRFKRMLARLREIGLGVDDAIESMDLLDEDALGRPTVARGLMARGYATSVEDAFQRLLGRGQPAYVPRSGLDPGGAIRAIREAGGLAVLAHFREAPGKLATIRELKELGLGGLEVYYWSFDQPTVDAMAVTAAELRLVPTGGSDFHGDEWSYPEAHAGLWIPPFVADALREALA